MASGGRVVSIEMQSALGLLGYISGLEIIVPIHSVYGRPL
jgi:hypothetical protein